MNSTPLHHRRHGLHVKMATVGAVLLSLAVGLAAAIYFSRPVSAAVPPASCFSFNSGTGIINKYYDYESNNPANPACPTEVDIPHTIGGASVLGFGSFAFQNTLATSVTIPDSITMIGDYAFSQGNLTSVTIPDSVTSIGRDAFYHNNLTSVVIPDSVTTIGYMAFSSNQLTSVHLGAGVENTGMSAFSGNQLTSITIPSTVTTIDAYSFQDNQLTSIVFPDVGTVAIEVNAFSLNNFDSLTIPSSVVAVGNGAFSYNNLSSVTVEGNPMFFYDSGGAGIEGGNPFTFNGIDWSATPYTYCSGDKACLAYYEEHAQIVRINATDPAFIAAHPYGLDIEEFLDDDWTAREGFRVTGAYVTNSTSVTVRYHDEDGTSLRPDATLIGIGSDGTPITGYGLGHVVDTLNVTDPDVWPYEFSTDMSAYFRAGVSTHFTPPSIQGYRVPAAQTIVLAAADNAVTFVYLQNSDITNQGGGSPTPLAPDSGVGNKLTLILLWVVLGIVVAGVSVVAHPDRRG
ncbi:MAG TPA: leucine-rich repeat domain-containing protein [Candidatus Saccharibacteria bacterium]|nr:leucine-rich repeat domain-containing protein [Candidatus Saccharibacteria bacterium]